MSQFHQKAKQDQEKKKSVIANQKTFGAMLKAKQSAIQQVIPKHISAERLFSVAMVAVNKTPALLECYIPSVVSAVHQCVSLGFEPNNALGQAYLVPFYNTKEKRKDAQVIIGYKGLAALMRRSGDITFFDGQVVYDCDNFDFEYGSNEKLIHKPTLSRPSDAKIIGAYSTARFKGSDNINFRVVGMTYLEEVKEGVRKKNFGKSPVWDQHPEPMMIKTAMRSHAKYLPLSIEMNAVLELDNQAHNGESQNSGLFDDVIDMEPMPDSEPVDAEYTETESVNRKPATCKPKTAETSTEAPTTTEPAATVKSEPASEVPAGVPAGSKEIDI